MKVPDTFIRQVSVEGSVKQVSIPTKEALLSSKYSCPTVLTLLMLDRMRVSFALFLEDVMTDMMTIARIPMMRRVTRSSMREKPKERCE